MSEVSPDSSPESWSGEDDEEVSIIQCGTSSGPFSMRLTRSWSPNGYDRAVQLFDRGYFDNSHFFRVIPKFLVQFGISYTNSQDLRDTAKEVIPDDPQPQPPISFEEGTISFAGNGKDSRTSQLFISYGKSKSLGTQPWETPIGTVVEGMDNIKNLYSGYGDMPPWGNGPKQHKIEREGRKYIEAEYPLLDKFLRCTVHEEAELSKPNAAEGVGMTNLDAIKTGRFADRLIGIQSEVAKLQKETLGIDSFASGTSAYRDHHQNAQIPQEVDLVTKVVVGVFLVVAFLSNFVNGSKKEQSKKS